MSDPRGLIYLRCTSERMETGVEVAYRLTFGSFFASPLPDRDLGMRRHLPQVCKCDTKQEQTGDHLMKTCTFANDQHQSVAEILYGRPALKWQIAWVRQSRNETLVLSVEALMDTYR